MHKTNEIHANHLDESFNDKPFRHFLRSDKNFHKAYVPFHFTAQPAKWKDPSKRLEKEKELKERKEFQAQKKMKNKYEHLYVSGNLQDHIKFEGEGVLLCNTKEDFHSNKKFVKKQKQVHTETNSEIYNLTNSDTYEHKVKNERTQRRLVKDLYLTNPMETLDKDQHAKLSSAIQDKNKKRCEKIGTYLGSSGIKDTLCGGAFANFQNKSLMNKKSLEKPMNIVRDPDVYSSAISTKASKKVFDCYYADGRGFYR